MNIHRIKLLRERQHLNQEALGKIVGATQQTISRIENNKYTAPLDLLIKLANYFNVSLDYLVGISDQRWSIDAITTINRDFEEYYDYICILKDLNDINKKTILIIMQRLRESQLEE